jgi:hypothetical protein
VPFEQDLSIDKWRRFLPDRGREGKGLIQFYQKHGGQRTVDVSDITSILPPLRMPD